MSSQGFQPEIQEPPGGKSGEKKKKRLIIERMLQQLDFFMPSKDLSQDEVNTWVAS